MLSKAKKQLEYAEINPHARYHKEGATVVRELLKKGSISEEAYIDLVGIETGRKLLGKNGFALCFDTGLVSFQSTLIRRYCEQKSSNWKTERSDVPGA